MSENNEKNIRYEKLIQRSGKRSDLPILDSGEFGYSIDSSQIFMGTDPNLSSNTNFNIVNIKSFPNAKKTIQQYLLESDKFKELTLGEDLKLEANTQEDALELSRYINKKHSDALRSLGATSISAIAWLDQNIEVITNKNITHFTNPSDFHVKYGPENNISNSTNQLLFKTLDNSDGGNFLEYPITELVKVDIDYFVVQNDGWHSRSGKITIVGNSNVYDGDVGFNDFQTLLTNEISNDFIEFNAEVSNEMLKIIYQQPSEHISKIYYRISRWSVEDFIGNNVELQPRYTESYRNALGLNNDIHGGE